MIVKYKELIYKPFAHNHRVVSVMTVRHNRIEVKIVKMVRDTITVKNVKNGKRQTFNKSEIRMLGNEIEIPNYLVKTIKL